MSPPPPNEVDRVLDEILQVAPAERSARLKRACGGNSDLRMEVARVLAACESARILDLPAIEFIPAAPESGFGGARLGPYRVLKELARGGMGIVLLAERADGHFEQLVALKVIKQGMDSDEIRRRFLTERQILARLQHANIARLLDGGVTAAGRPWFAMEFVDGVPITVYCDSKRLDVSGRLMLFEQVCRAVRHAHHSRVVHRDLKPSNILVTPDGGVKLLDFGIAKLLSEEAGDASVLTRLDMRIMTPAYAAPEQVRGEEITTATDVYALGAVLYELLTGRCAQRFERYSPAEVERVVCATDPDMGRLRRRLIGDLDTIILKAMRKEARRRYPSTDELLGDLQRYRDGLPVLARPSSRLYRARKFVARHWIGGGAMAAVAVALVAGLAPLRASLAIRRRLLQEINGLR